MASFQDFVSESEESEVDLSIDELGSEYFDYGANTRKPWPFQIRAVEQVWDAIDRGYKAPLLVSPTGSGKTFMSGMILYEATKRRGMRCAFTVDRLILLEQARITFEGMGIRCGQIIADKPTDSRAEVQLISKDTFASRYIDRYGTLRQNSHLGNFDLIIHDEAHRSPNASHTHLRNVFPKAYVLGLTASPILSNGKPLGVPYFDTMIEAAKPSELLKAGFIIPAEVWSPDRPDFRGAMCKAKNSDYNKEKALAEMRRDNIVGSSLRNWQEKAGGSQTLVFCVNRKHAKWNARYYNSEGIRSAYIGCEMNELERKTIFARFASGAVKCLHSSDLLTEGVDFPFVECLQILKPTRSLRLWLQMIGRGMRQHTFPDGRVKDKFILIDHTGGCIAHCIPGYDIPWNLGTERIEEIMKREREIDPSKVARACPQCTYTMPQGRSICPNCGYEFRIHIDFEDIESSPGNLTLIKKSTETIPSDASPDEVQAFIQKKRRTEWIKALRTAKKNNRTWAAAAAQFSNMCGILPWTAGMTPLAPGSNWKALVMDTPDLIP